VVPDADAELATKGSGDSSGSGLLIGNRLFKLDDGFVAAALLVHTRIESKGRSPLHVLRVVVRVVDVRPRIVIGYHKAVEVPLIAQDLVEKAVVAAGLVHAVRIQTWKVADRE
jgi:hypothetical protein